MHSVQPAGSAISKKIRDVIRHRVINLFYPAVRGCIPDSWWVRPVVLKKIEKIPARLLILSWGA
jgi:hypothetical protein